MKVNHIRQLDVSWKNTFNSNLKHHGSINTAFSIADANGYPFVAWNGYVYDVRSNGMDSDKIIAADDLPS